MESQDRTDTHKHHLDWSETENHHSLKEGDVVRECGLYFRLLGVFRTQHSQPLTVGLLRGIVLVTEDVGTVGGWEVGHVIRWAKTDMREWVRLERQMYIGRLLRLTLHFGLESQRIQDLPSIRCVCVHVQAGMNEDVCEATELLKVIHVKMLSVIHSGMVSVDSKTMAGENHHHSQRCTHTTDSKLALLVKFWSTHCSKHVGVVRCKLSIYIPC